MKKKSENAKNKDWQAPVHLPHAKPEDYDVSIGSAQGSAHAPKPEIVRRNSNDNATLSKREQKECGQLPLHDEEIGGA